MKVPIKVVSAGAGTALLVAVIAATVRYKPSSCKVNDGVIPKQASSSTFIILPAAAHQPQASSAVAALSDIKSLAARCQAATVKDVCSIMTSSKPAVNGRNTEHLFIAGIGGVDAGVFNRLREAGD
ncbi:MAG: hypothetical protein H7224_10055 [Polaromonas sp.]|nr:hypothetical protein [Polaromonas sp.]